MKEFDKLVQETMDELADMESWDEVDWREITKKLFLVPKKVPNEYRDFRVKNRNDWLKFTYYYSLNKANNKIKLPKKQTKKEELNAASILQDALNEIEKEKAVE